MPDSPADKAKAEIPFGVVELTAQFAEPILESLRDYIPVMGSMLSALKPFGFGPDGVEIKNLSEKLTDRGIVLKRTAVPIISFTLTVTKLSIYIENADWNDVAKVLECANAGFEAARRAARFQVASQQLVLAMHLQFKETSLATVTKSLLTEKSLALLDGEPKCHGVILMRDKATIVIDASGSFANALFIRITRQHSSDAAISLMADTLYIDEKRVVEVLGVDTEL